MTDTQKKLADAVSSFITGNITVDINSDVHAIIDNFVSSVENAHNITKNSKLIFRSI
jgi:D-mannonate dehydratase